MSYKKHKNQTGLPPGAVKYVFDVYTPDGRRPRKNVRCQPSVVKELYRRWERKVMIPKEKEDSILLKDALPEPYDQHVAKLQREMLSHFGANRDVRGITSIEVAGFVKERAACYAPATVRNDIQYLRSFFTKLHARGYIRANPTIDLKKPKALPREVYASDRDVEAIVNAARKSTVYLPVIIALTTGCRVSEIISIEWDFIDLERNVIRIPAHLTKARKPRVVVIHPAVREALLELPNREGRIINIDRFAVLASFKTHVAEKVKLRAADGSRLHFHDLRHIYGSLLLNAGLDIHDVSKALGHANTSITEQVYVQHAREGLVERLRDVDFGLGQNTVN